MLRPIYFSFSFLLLLQFLAAQPAKEPLSPVVEEVKKAVNNEAAPLFLDEAILEFTLRADLTTVFSDRSDDPAYQPAWLEGNLNSEPFRLPILIKARGNFRKKAENCDVPPLRMKFSGDKSDMGVFAGQKKLKLVTHCQEEEYVLKEYLVYRAFNVLTDSSLRVRLARITYVDELGQYPQETHFAFFIEDDDDMALRHNGYIVKDKPIEIEEVHQEYQLLLYTFMYMIGDRDWDIGLQKNIKVMQGGPGEKYVPVPYDFDFCGAVDAPYTYKNIIGEGEKVEWRYFKQICRDEQSFSKCFSLFQDKKDQIFALYTDHPYLRESTAKKVLKYFEEFYKTIEDPKKVRKVFLEACPDRE